MVPAIVGETCWKHAAPGLSAPPAPDWRRHVTAVSRIRGPEGHERTRRRVKLSTGGHRRKQRDTRGHDIRPVRDHEAPRLNPRPNASLPPPHPHPLPCGEREYVILPHPYPLPCGEREYVIPLTPTLSPAGRGRFLRRVWPWPGPARASPPSGELRARGAELPVRACPLCREPRIRNHTGRPARFRHDASWMAIRLPLRRAGYHHLFQPESTHTLTSG